MSNDPYQSPQVPQQEPKPGVLSNDDKTMGMLAHLLGIFTGFIGPLVIYLMKKDENGFAAAEAKESLNFQLTMLIVQFASIILMFVLIGFFTSMAAGVCALVFCIMGTMKANNGEHYRYPINIRMIN